MNTHGREMSPMELRDHIISFLKEHKSGSLATYLDGRPRCSPIQYFVGNEMDIYILSAGGDKFKAIEENPDVCLLVNTEYINFRKIKGVQVFGKATTSIENRTLFEEALKYSPDPHLIEMNRESLKVIKIVPHEVVYLDSLEDGDRTKQILEHNRVTLKEDELTPVH
ncbi:pyridoxamine 5'-phosphate oxidase family protein [Alkaliphilus sp. B6464]|nr:pyridoxamine 5'-phosphate oxidase family protein [Alkaliphilus sp. B6464]